LNQPCSILSKAKITTTIKPPSTQGVSSYQTRLRECQRDTTARRQTPSCAVSTAKPAIAAPAASGHVQYRPTIHLRASPNPSRHHPMAGDPTPPPDDPLQRCDTIPIARARRRGFIQSGFNEVAHRAKTMPVSRATSQNPPDSLIIARVLTSRPSLYGQRPATVIA
jgi:hypothetical protein